MGCTYTFDPLVYQIMIIYCLFIVYLLFIYCLFIVFNIFGIGLFTIIFTQKKQILIYFIKNE